MRKKEQKNQMKSENFSEQINDKRSKNFLPSKLLSLLDFSGEKYTIKIA